MSFHVNINLAGLIAFVRRSEEGAETKLTALLVHQPKRPGDAIAAHYPRLSYGPQIGKSPCAKLSYWNLLRENVTLDWVGAPGSKDAYTAPTFNYVPQLGGIIGGPAILRPECLRPDATAPDEVVAQIEIDQGKLDREHVATACYFDKGAEEVEVGFQFRPQFALPNPSWPEQKVADMVYWQIESPSGATGLKVVATSLDEPLRERALELAPMNGKVDLCITNSPAQGQSRCSLRRGGTANAHWRRYEDLLTSPTSPSHQRRVPHSPVDKPDGAPTPQSTSPAARPMCPPTEI